MSPPAQLRQAKWLGGEQVRSQQRHRASGAAAKGGCRQGCRGRAGNLPPSAGVLEPWRPRPVAPPRASCRDVARSPVAAAGGRWGGAGAAPGVAGAGRCRALPRDHTGLGRAATGTRGCECAMRARRGRCVCPRVPLPSRRSSGRQNGKRTSRTRQPREARRGEIGDGGRGVAAPRSLGPPHGAPESERGGQRAGCAAAATPGGCRPRPPAAQALPLFSPPPGLSRTPCKEARPVCSSQAARSRT